MPFHTPLQAVLKRVLDHQTLLDKIRSAFERPCRYEEVFELVEQAKSKGTTLH
jgi:hypothetical protein